MSTNNLFTRGYQEIGMLRRMNSLKDNLIRLRKAEGLSQKGLADKAGVAQNTIAAIESGETKRTKFLPELARALKVKMHDLDPNVAAQDSFIVADPELIGALDFPLYESVDAGEGALVVSNEPVDRIGRPAPLANVRDAYGVIVAGDSMTPEYRPGDMALVHPHTPPTYGQVCIFRRDHNGEFHATIKEYRGQTAEHWKVLRHQPEEKEFTLKKRDWPVCHVVIGKYSRR